MGSDGGLCLADAERCVIIVCSTDETVLGPREKPVILGFQWASLSTISSQERQYLSQCHFWQLCYLIRQPLCCISTFRSQIRKLQSQSLVHGEQCFKAAVLVLGGRSDLEMQERTLHSQHSYVLALIRYTWGTLFPLWLHLFPLLSSCMLFIHWTTFASERENRYSCQDNNC